MLRHYPHAMIKDIVLEIFKIRTSSNSKEVGKEAQSFFIDLFKVISLIPNFVMNYPYNSEHQDFSNLSLRNLLKRFILILYSYSRPTFSVQLLL